MILHHMIVNRMFGTNCFLFGDANTREIMIIDPGGNGPEIIRKVSDNNLTPLGIILTHGHRDHTGAAKEIRDHYKIPIYGNQKDLRTLGKNIYECKLEINQYHRHPRGSWSTRSRRSNPNRFS